jgi:hypothetical protein
MELISAFHVLQKFKDKIKTEDVDELDDSNLESFELEMEVENDALAQLDGLLEWMDSKIQSTKKVCSWFLLDISDLTLEPERRVLVCQLDTGERYPDYRETAMMWLNASTLRDWWAQIISCPPIICTSS